MIYLLLTMGNFLLVTCFYLFTLQAQGNVLESDVSFYLFTGKNINTGFKVTKETVNIDKTCQVVFLVHGYVESYLVSWYTELKNAYINKSNQTCVIEVDWAKPASNVIYLTAANDTKGVGYYIAELIKVLVSKLDIPIKNIHVTGHSLGSHVAGFTGKALLKSGLKLGRITGLDPAGPCFVKPLLCAGDLLSKNDAEVLVVIHTDRYKWGYPTSFGGVDFFPNDGKALQPGCPDLETGNILTCSHQRSHEYFADALNHPGTLIGYLCGNYQQFTARNCNDHKHIDMGADLTTDDYGDYYLTTNSMVPYGQGLRDVIKTKKINRFKH